MSAHGTRLVVSNLAIADGITQLDLVNATHLRASTISVILKNLEDSGIVERKRDENDLRILRVYLTDKGKEIDKNNIERLRATDSLALAGLDDSEKEQLMHLLKKIRNNLLEKTEAHT
jgi:DNA-binding MarR family transcriptional regulator